MESQLVQRIVHIRLTIIEPLHQVIPGYVVMPQFIDPKMYNANTQYIDDEILGDVFLLS